MYMADRPVDAAAAEQLAHAAGRVVANSKVERVAGMAYLQAVFAQAANQALINLLKRHNIISEKELEKCLAEEYETRFKQLSGSSGVIVQSAPLVRPKGDA
jgi:hypothetical protein